MRHQVLGIIHDEHAAHIELDAATVFTVPQIKGCTCRQIQQLALTLAEPADNILFTYEFASASRIVRMNSQEKSPAPAWMGWNIGRWDGESLVIDVNDQMAETWFDRAGNYHSDALTVTERYTAIDANTLQYEATIEDPKVFSKPWKMSMPLYRRVEKNAQLGQFKCVEFVTELMYGHLRKEPIK